MSQYQGCCARLISSRITRKLSLTPEGELFLRHCKDMRNATQSAFEAVAHGQAEPRGTDRMSIPVTFALSTLASELPVFRRAIRRYSSISGCSIAPLTR